MSEFDGPPDLNDLSAEQMYDKALHHETTADEDAEYFEVNEDYLKTEAGRENDQRTAAAMEAERQAKRSTGDFDPVEAARAEIARIHGQNPASETSSAEPDEPPSN